MKTREQERMALAYRQVEAVSHFEPTKKDGSTRAEYTDGYGRICLHFPVLVRTSGLCQALMFVHTRDKRYANDYLRDLDHHLHQAGLLDKPQKLLDVAANVDLPTYMLLTREILACGVWLRRFAQSILKVDLAQTEAS